MKTAANVTSAEVTSKNVTTKNIEKVDIKSIVICAMCIALTYIATAFINIRYRFRQMVDWCILEMYHCSLQQFYLERRREPSQVELEWHYLIY